MKKTIASVVCLVLGVTGLTGCTKYDAAFTQKSYTAESEEIAEVIVDVRDRQIEVMLSNDNQIHIDYFENTSRSDRN